MVYFKDSFLFLHTYFQIYFFVYVQEITKKELERKIFNPKLFALKTDYYFIYIKLGMKKSFLIFKYFLFIFLNFYIIFLINLIYINLNFHLVRIIY